jgi:two-component system, sensor histidine kinase YesM
MVTRAACYYEEDNAMGKGLPNPLARMSVKQQLILLFVILVSPVFVFHWYGNAKAEEILKRHVTHAYAELNKLNSLLISRDVDTVNRITRAIIQDPVTQKMNADTPLTFAERLRNYYAMEQLLNSYSFGINGGEAIYYTLFVYDPTGVYDVAPNHLVNRPSGVYFYSDRQKPDWIAEAEARDGSGFLRIVPYIGNDTTGQGTLCYVRAVNSIYRGQDMIGVLVATMDRKIGQSLQTVSLPDGEIYLTDESNRIMAATNPNPGKILQLPDALTVNRSTADVLDLVDSDMIYVMNENERANQTLVYKIPVHTLLQQQNELKRVIQLIEVVFCLFAVLVMTYFWRGMMTPLQKLATFVRTYEPAQMVPSTPGGKRKDELGVLVSAVYDMARRLNAFIHDRYAMELRQKETQLQLLYQQINPHMLYNTLETIYWKSMLEGRSESAEMIKELSKLMKIGLSHGRDIITMEEELEHAQAYTLLQEKRLEQSFRIVWDIPPELLSLNIPKITLQPLIENAILHGIKNMGDDGEIAVRATKANDFVLIDVEDNGYKEVDLDAIRKLLSDTRPDPSHGYGIRNVNQRLQLHFGPAYGLRYRKREGGGTIATVELPAGQEEEG